MNQFENHDLVVNIYNTLRDHGVLKNDAPLQTLTTEERRFLEEIDKCIEGELENLRTDFHNAGYNMGVYDGRQEVSP